MGIGAATGVGIEMSTAVDRDFDSESDPDMRSRRMGYCHPNLRES